ncbi:MAG: helix-turn-helix transcriptional regulator [Algicola sp.]|nr:helix-turn-helix transcriptional regulator [Algicola sp.]
MENGHFKQPALTITQLAQQLNTPEHQLRKLINQHLNFSNFSSFLNSYRIKEACVRLQNISQAKTHILTIAIELGYGSTGPFNRAFKMVTGQTPTQYRQAYLDQQG